ncbi:hypothetical protein FCH28_13610 [Streptomyces piniterrae]|uniref:Secreted protein n=1 Tax=Streptomyces piniterrae TaxID=2571125 RepID=A0A4U0NJF8_9ACTN|nr:hypothetical protein [Streptomyces piniterrae]TJZ54213.1 hypothetical protein FCH28_13610 [Streptomyces piniterrae]
MKIAKAAAGVVGVALVLGAATPALAAPGPLDGETALLDSNTVSKQDVKNPLDGVNADVLIGAVGKVADKLKTNNDLASKTNALGAGSAL